MNKKIYFLLLVFLNISCVTQKVITEKSLTSSYDKFSTFIWSKNKNDSIVFNKKNLELIALKKGKYYRKLGRYISYLIDGDSIIKTPLTFSERSKILAHLIDYITTSHQYSMIESLIYNDEYIEYYKEFEQNNYYNLPNFKKEYRKKFEELKPTKKIDLPAKVILKNKY